MQEKKEMVWVTLFCIMICEIQMMVLRGQMPNPHLALGRPIQGLGHREKTMYDSFAWSNQRRKSWRWEARSNFFSRELLKRPNTQSQEWSQKWRWKQAQKWTGTGTDGKVSELISSAWVLLIPSCWHLNKTWAPTFDCLNTWKLTLVNAWKSICFKVA